MESKSEKSALTNKDFSEFMEARTHTQRMKIFFNHSQKNEEYKRRNNMENYNTGSAVSQEEISKQFEEFCKTKGIVAKFKVAFTHMGENAKKQHAQDKANIEALKNSEENKEFREFLHTKGFKAKCKLVIENIKKSAANASKETAKRLEKLHAQTQANINAHRVNAKAPVEYSAKDLAAEFNAFLKERGLDEKYSVQIEEK